MVKDNWCGLLFSVYCAVVVVCSGVNGMDGDMQCKRIGDTQKTNNDYRQSLLTEEERIRFGLQEEAILAQINRFTMLKQCAEHVIIIDDLWNKCSDFLEKIGGNTSVLDEFIHDDNLWKNEYMEASSDECAVSWNIILFLSLKTSGVFFNSKKEHVAFIDSVRGLIPMSSIFPMGMATLLKTIYSRGVALNSLKSLWQLAIGLSDYSIEDTGVTVFCFANGVGIADFNEHYDSYNYRYHDYLLGKESPTHLLSSVYWGIKNGYISQQQLPL
ncbi:MAG: hypothetical protein LBB21_03920 [Holosporaceae bacterium]|jgi:hypothetical protein|nr:hypothetical protein [Holosporaceae bacterium]